jgi:hypothetical protein
MLDSDYWLLISRLGAGIYPFVGMSYNDFCATLFQQITTLAYEVAARSH